ncbi:MAG: glycosyltransferase family 4 protein [bacterium]|nr:glycosyltransferase family 4 protein [bacterium]
MSNAKKIVFAINDLSFGGGQKTVVEETNGLFKGGHEVFVLTLLPRLGEKDMASELKIPPDHIVNIPFQSLWDFAAFIKLVKWLRRTKPDIIFSNLFFTNTAVRLARIFRFRTRVFVREGNLPVEKSLAVKIVDSCLMFLTEKIIVNAAAIKDGFKKLWISQKKIIVIYNGINERFFENPTAQDRSQLRQSLGIGDDEVVLICIASLNNKKGYQYLLEAFRDIGLYYKKGVALLIVGDGPERTKLEVQVMRYKLDDRVRFLGNRGDVRELLTAADVFILTSLWEGMPNAMLEAMATGLPVIATAVGGIVEIVDNGKNGLLVNPRNSMEISKAMAELIAAPGKRRAMGESARSSVSSLTWDNHIRNLIKLINS